MFGFGGSGSAKKKPRDVRFNFSADCGTALRAARDEADRLRHNYVGTEHILLGLVRDPGSPAATRLAQLGAEPARVRAEVERSVRAGDSQHEPGAELPYTSRAKKVLEEAMAEAVETEADGVDGRVLLAGLAREGKGIGATVLHDLGVTLARLRGDAPEAAAPSLVRIDDASDRSIYEQIVQQLKEAVAVGHLMPGARLPSVRALADALDVAPGTVARAYAELERLGVVVTGGARGTRVAERTPAAPRLTADLAGLIRPVVVAAYHQGATAADLRAALDRAMDGIYPAGEAPAS